MPFRILCGWLWLAALVVPAFAEEPGPPVDRNPAVIELYYVDRGQVGEPELAVFATGQVRAKVGAGAIWGTMSPQQVESLLTALLRTDDLATLTSQSVQQDVQQAATSSGGLSTQFANAGNTIIRLRTSQGVTQIEAHAVGLSANRFPGASKLQKVASAQDRLENLRAITMVGGTEAAQRLAGMASQQLAQERGERVSVTAQDLRMVRSMTDGSRYCQFVVRPPDRAAMSWVVSLMEAPGEAPRVSVLPDGQRRQ